MQRNQTDFYYTFVAFSVIVSRRVSNMDKLEASEQTRNR
jgi:hypothetical protein